MTADHVLGEPLPALPKPNFRLVPLRSSNQVPARVADIFAKAGVPAGLIGYDYQALPEAVVLAGSGELGLVAFGTSGLFGRICIDPASSEVVFVPKEDVPVVSFVNKDLDSFIRCVEAVIARFPFYADEEQDEYSEEADELRGVLAGIDGSILEHAGFWDDFCWDVEMGEYGDWDD